MAPDKVAPCSTQPDRLAPVRSAPVNTAPRRSDPVMSASRIRALRSTVLAMDVPWPNTRPSRAPIMLASLKFAPDTSEWSWRIA